MVNMDDTVHVNYPGKGRQKSRSMLTAENSNLTFISSQRLKVESKAGGCRSPSRPINSRERFRQNFQRYLKLTQSYHTRRRHLRQDLYKSRESAWCRMLLPSTVKPHISHASCQDKESSQNSPGLPETLEALKKLRLSSGYPNTDDF
ncbi:hypothetical protein ACRRTK_001143 [Alexandromys fortis]